MPQWGRPPGAGVGKYMEEMEDVYRFQEVDSDDEKHGVTLDSGLQRMSNGKHFNPDELYFNDMDLRAWERRTADMDGLAYGEDYGYPEDEGYYDDGTGNIMTPSEYEEFLFQRVLDKIRFARATGVSDVQLTPEELEVYQSRLLRPWGAPAARIPHPKTRPVSTGSAPMNSGTNAALVNSSSHTANHGSSSTRSKKSQQRTSLFSARPKKEKPSSRKRADSNVSKMSKDSETSTQPPGFMIPGPNGQPMFAPISAYNHARIPREPAMRPNGSPPRAGSRSASISSRQAQTPPRMSPPREFPGAFPSGSPIRYTREPTPPLRQRPSSSSSSRQSSLPDVAGSSGPQPSRLVPFPVTDYQHYTAEPYQYYSPGQSHASSPQASSSQPQYARRVASGPPDYTAMPRRVPVPVQRASAGVHGSYSDPILERPELQRGASGASDAPEVLVDVVPEADNGQGYKVQTQTSKGSGSSSRTDSERRRRSGRSRRK